ncbi:Mitochondrial proton/calcium exchanger protein [Nymphon striatum]|nr:Mitochondrial proton/calcium exchanger protein [Nymphon striatum]
MRVPIPYWHVNHRVMNKPVERPFNCRLYRGGTLIDLHDEQQYFRFIYYSIHGRNGKQYRSQCKKYGLQNSFALQVPSSSINNFDSYYDCFLLSHRKFHLSASLCEKERSKVEQTVKQLKDDLQKSKKETPTVIVEDIPIPSSSEKPTASVVAQKKSIGQRVIAVIKHYYHGFRLLFIDIRVSSRLLWRILNGNSLSRREHKQLVRTVSDLFRLVPFSVFIIVPFMEFLLPVVLKLFPSMLPSTFQNLEARQAKYKKELKMKLEVAKFLQDTLEEMALQSSGDKSSLKAKEFYAFFLKIRESGEQATNDEILKFSKLFEDEITLDNMPRPQLIALCKLLELQPIGTNNFLRFQLRMRLRNLLADDKMIRMEGLNSLTVEELQIACKSRGMRALGITTERLRSQLSQWLELSLIERIPPALLLLSRALYLPENLPASDQLKATISSLPESVATQAMYKIGEKEGKVHNKTKLDIIKKEEEAIKREKKKHWKLLVNKNRLKLCFEYFVLLAVEKKAEQIEQPASVQEAIRDRVPDIPVHVLDNQDILVDTAPIIGDKETKIDEKLSQEDFEHLEDALDNIAAEKEKLWIEKEELADLKEDMAEYKEDIEELVDIKVLSGEPEKNLRVSTAAIQLSKKVNKMINRLDVHIDELQKEKSVLEEDLDQKLEEGFEKLIQQKDDTVTIADLINAMKKLQTSSDETRFAVITQVLDKLDYDHDGAVKVEDVLKVVALIGNEEIKIDPEQMEEIIDLLEKEESLDFAEKIERQIEKDQRLQDSATKDISDGGEIVQEIKGAMHENTEKRKSQKEQLFSSSYFEKLDSEEGFHVNRTKLENFKQCNYKGKLRGSNNSWAAVSTCDNQISAVIFDGNETIFIEPVVSSSRNESHYYFMTSQDLKSITGKCGVEENRVKRHADVKMPAGSNHRSRYVELLLVVDSLQLYEPLNIYIALVGIVIWDDFDKIKISSSGETTLKHFLKYRWKKLLYDYPNDNAQLLTGAKFMNSIVGKASKSSICTAKYSGGVNMDHGVIGLVAATVAHEMGHNFGLGHDRKGCRCSAAKCIMSSVSSAKVPTTWSSCSQSHLLKIDKMKLDFCLYNKPKLLLGPVCGNGFVEDGEECDCGENTYCKCCDVKNCKLFSNATCATGSCCDLSTCQFEHIGHVCRPSINECDLSEYCNGFAEYCPNNYYVADGTNCKVQPTKMYTILKKEGKRLRMQCKLLKKKEKKVVYLDIASLKLNELGGGGATLDIAPPPSPRILDMSQNLYIVDDCDVKCGMMQCTNKEGQLKFAGKVTKHMASITVHGRDGKKLKCRSVIMDVGPGTPDPGMVPDGLKCGDDKVLVL